MEYFFGVLFFFQLFFISTFFSDPTIQILRFIILAHFALEQFLSWFLNSASFQKFTANHSAVPLRRFKHRDGIVTQEVANGELSTCVHWIISFHESHESENVGVQTALIFLHELDEVSLWWFRDESHAAAQRVFLGAESVVGWDHSWVGRCLWAFGDDVEFIDSVGGV